MRRKDRELSEYDALKIIDECVYATLSCVDGDGVFALPISVARGKGDLEKSVFIHGALNSSKDRLYRDGKEVVLVAVASANVPILNQKELEILKTSELGAKVFTTEYKSAIAITKAYKITKDCQKIAALRALCEKYTPKYMTRFNEAATYDLAHTAIWELKIISISAKAKIIKS